LTRISSHCTSASTKTVSGASIIYQHSNAVNAVVARILNIICSCECCRVYQGELQGSVDADWAAQDCNIRQRRAIQCSMVGVIACMYLRETSES
jgi:hypothetical protein